MGEEQALRLQNAGCPDNGPDRNWIHRWHAVFRLHTVLPLRGTCRNNRQTAGEREADPDSRFVAFAELGTLSIKGDATESQKRTVKKFFQK